MQRVSSVPAVQLNSQLVWKSSHTHPSLNINPTSLTDLKRLSDLPIYPLKKTKAFCHKLVVRFLNPAHERMTVTYDGGFHTSVKHFLVELHATNHSACCATYNGGDKSVVSGINTYLHAQSRFSYMSLRSEKNRLLIFIF